MGKFGTTSIPATDTSVFSVHPKKFLGYRYILPNTPLYKISTVSDPSGSGRVDMLTGPVAAARAVVATGAWVKSNHDMYLIRGSVGA